MSSTKAPDRGDSSGDGFRMSITVEAMREVDRIAAAGGILNPVLFVKVIPGGCSGFQYEYSIESLLDLSKSDDGLLFVESMGRQAVAVDSVSSKYLGGSELAFEDTLEHRGFVVNNPKATSGCGCGKSFSV